MMARQAKLDSMVAQTAIKGWACLHICQQQSSAVFRDPLRWRMLRHFSRPPAQWKRSSTSWTLRDVAYSLTWLFSFVMQYSCPSQDM